MNDESDYHLQRIGQKLLSLKSTDRLNKTDRESIESIVNTDIPAAQKCIKNERETHEAIHDGIERAEAYFGAGYKVKSRKIAQERACVLLTKNNNVIAYLEALKDNDDRKTNISRTMQLNRLDTLYAMAVKQENVSAGASVIREQNEMLGFHREHAPNTEKEERRRQIVEQELKELERIARQRTEALSERTGTPTPAELDAQWGTSDKASNGNRW